MKADEAKIEKGVKASKIAKKKVNPFTKLMEDKERIAEAVNHNESLSSLKDIRFVRPL